MGTSSPLESAEASHQCPIPRRLWKAASSGDHWLNRKNCGVPEMGLVTVFCPLTTTGAGELVVQTAAEPRFVVDCRVKPASLAGQLRTTLDPEGIKATWGGVAGPMVNRKPYHELIKW